MVGAKVFNINTIHKRPNFATTSKIHVVVGELMQHMLETFILFVETAID